MSLKSTVFVGSATNIQSFLPENQFDLVISGPPYWNEVEYSKDQGQLSAIDDYSEFLNSISKVWQGCASTLKEGGVLVLWVHDFFRRDNGSFVHIPFHADIIKSMPDNIRCRNILIWDRYLHKDRGSIEISEKISTRLQYVLIFQKQGQHHTNSDLIKESLRQLYWNPVWGHKTHPKIIGSRSLFRILFRLQNRLPFFGFLKEKLSKTVLKDNHIFSDYKTECPEEVAVRLIEKFTKPGDSILDPFLGSGTSMKVANRLGRACVGIEINKEALPVIQKKLGYLPEIRYVP